MVHQGVHKRTKSCLGFQTPQPEAPRQRQHPPDKPFLKSFWADGGVSGYTCDGQTHLFSQLSVDRRSVRSVLSNPRQNRPHDRVQRGPVVGRTAIDHFFSDDPFPVTMANRVSGRVL